ncbi:hypothetical protein SAMN05216371_8276 [Streptomyces sp. TLI_053]|uniref:hypothetical protein n=1 Tax=Streptomyces sp. TLI_053 TaxID=1855352 RepID=UPI00087AC00D|nr:hypothetical protein [Streptomyces sp. TLI_053]SDT83445.1 hypothetical protein SAMN05216371_8276 [Streptomyces sp. TLI_053]
MPVSITPEEVRELWDAPARTAVIDRGEDLAPVTKEDLAALADQVDTDDRGRPLADQWDVLADQLNTVEAEPAAGPAADILQAVEDARRYRDKVKADADEEFNSLVRSAMLNRKVTKVKVAELEKAADLSRSRLYQIRDGRR